MLFNSIDFALFLPIVFIFYWGLFAKQLKIQNLFLVLSSYVFYGWWDWRFLLLIFFSSVVDYTLGIGLFKAKKQSLRKLFLLASLTVNLGLLGLFKYYNFFLENFLEVFSFFGKELNSASLSIILPVGISFYTFQTLSYTIDIYREKLKPTDDIIAFLAFVSFFPQLVAGPIERASNLLPQFFKERKFEYNKAIDGLRQILWGLFKKVVIADNCAEFANLIFNNSQDYPGSVLLLGAVFFAFQIYGDFSGYSDIAIGTSRLFGFDLKQNFAFPYFSRDIAEFWRRWHISLSTWFRDYLYIPLGGSRVGIAKKIRNTFAIFIVSGFWHGANWTFIVWGALNALYFLPSLLRDRNRQHLEIVAKDKLLPTLRESIGILTTFFLTVIAWIFFRAENLDHAFYFLSKIFSVSVFSVSFFPGLYRSGVVVILVLIFLIIEWMGREENYAIEKLWLKKSIVHRWGMYYFLGLLILLFSGQKQEFIYFQF